MLPLKVLLGLPDSRITDGEVGVEIEVEGSNICSPPATLWTHTRDSSLRGDSIEYVLRKPLSYQDSLASVDLLMKQMRVKGTKINDSIRAGVHVHFNAQDYNIIDLYKHIITYLIVESVLVAYSGENREGNLFCLRADDAEELISTIILVAQDADLGHFHTDHIRYASMNLASLWKYGSIEFRSFRTPTDLTEVKNWITLLKRVKDFSQSFDTPLHIVNYFSESNHLDFIRDCFGDCYPLVSGVNDLHKRLKSGVRTAQLVTHAVNWNDFIDGSKNNIFGKVQAESSKKMIKPKCSRDIYNEPLPQKGKDEPQLYYSESTSVPDSMPRGLGSIAMTPARARAILSAADRVTQQSTIVRRTTR